MFNNFQNMQWPFGHPFEGITKPASEVATKIQAVNAETADFVRNSLEKSRGHFEKLTGVKNFEEVVQLQSEFAKSACEDFIARSTKIGNMYSDFVRGAFSQAEVKPASNTAPSTSAKNASRAAK